MQNNFPRRAENYTTPALVMAFVNMLWILCVVWATWGLLACLLLGTALNHAITLLQARRDGPQA